LRGTGSQECSEKNRQGNVRQGNGEKTISSFIPLPNIPLPIFLQFISRGEAIVRGMMVKGMIVPSLLPIPLTIIPLTNLLENEQLWTIALQRGFDGRFFSTDFIDDTDGQHFFSYPCHLVRQAKPG
jgi:hypothetical protein